MRLIKRRPLMIPVVLLSLVVGVRTSFATDMNDQSVGTLFNCSGRAVKLDPSEALKLITKRTGIEPPSMLHNAQLHGTVTVEVCLNEGGRVCAIRAINGNPMAVAAVIRSVRGWGFEPYKREAKPMPIIGPLTVKYDFRGISQRARCSNTRSASIRSMY